MRVIPSVDDLSTVWRLLVLRAGIVLVLSIAALPWPVASLAVIVVLVSIIAVVAALFDAALSGALQLRTAGGWALLPEALIGVALGGAVLLYPLVPLGVVTVLLSLWILARGLLLLAVVGRTASAGVLRTLAMGWAAASVLVPVAILAEWSEANIVYVLAVLLTYVLIWSGLELSVGLHLRARARRPIPA
jgi:uncharacterized membrane protein HdeD (DUF308 family)